MKKKDLEAIRRYSKDREAFQKISSIISRADEEERGQRSFHRSLFEDSPEAIAIVDQHERIVDANGSFCALFQYETQELRGYHLKEKIEFLNQQGSVPMAELARKREDGEQRVTCRRKDGHRVPSLITVFPIDSEDPSRSVSVIFRPLSWEERTEELDTILKALVEAVNGSVALSDLLGLAHSGLAKLIDSDSFTVALWNARREAYDLPYLRDAYDGEDQEKLVPLRETLSDYVRKTGKPLLADTKVQRDLLKSGDVVLSDYPSFVWLGVPLRSGGKVMGVMAVQSYARRTGYVSEDLAILERLADHLAPLVAFKLRDDDLREREKFHRSFFDEGLIGMFSCSADRGILLNANERFSRIVGLTAPIGKSLEDFLPNFQDLRSRLKKEGQIERLELRMKLESSRICWVAISAKLTSEGDIIEGFLEDITRQKRAEQDMQDRLAWFDHARDAIIVRNLEDQIIYWNKSAERLYGWKADEVVGRSIQDVLFRDASRQLADTLKILPQRGEWRGELQQLTKDGREVTVESRWTLMYDPEGHPKSILFINTDISEKKTIEDRLRRSQRMESLGSLAGSIAHDLNNVMSPLLISVEYLKKRFGDSDSQDMLNLLEMSVRRGVSIVKQVLTFVRGTQEEFEPVQVGQLVNEVKQMILKTFPESVKVKSHVSSDLWKISGDVNQLHRVLLNLCINARDAMPQGGALEIGAENVMVDEFFAKMNKQTSTGPFVMISVSDTGSGIAPENLGKIFDPFFSTKDARQGTGLGLSSVSTIVEKHHGFTHVDSQVGRGTEFRVYLPAVSVHAASESQVTAEPLDGGNGELILVVDDENLICEITRESLETCGYRVITAKDGVEAMVLYGKNKDEVKLVLIDLVMPFMDGINTVRAMKIIDPDVRIIAISGFMPDKGVLDNEGGNVKALLPKPYSAAKLLATMKQVLEDN